MSGRRCSRSPLTGDNISGSEFSPIFSFRLFSVTTFSHRMAPRIQKLILQKLAGAPTYLGLDPFSDTGGNFGFCRRSFELVPPSLLGWYFLYSFFLLFSFLASRRRYLRLVFLTTLKVWQKSSVREIPGP